MVPEARELQTKPRNRERFVCIFPRKWWLKHENYRQNRRIEGDLSVALAKQLLKHTKKV